MYICCRLCVGWLCFIPHIIRICLFDRWLLCPSFYLYGPGPFVWVFAFRRIAWLYFVIPCFISVVLGGRGFWPVVGWGSRSPVFKWFPRVVSLSGATLVIQVRGWVVPALSMAGGVCPALCFW